MTRTAIVLAGAAFLLYVPFLTYSPPYLGQDEVFFGVSAHAIATTGRDLNGRFMPLYFQWPGRTPAVWFQPMEVYVTALFLRLLPLSQWAIRLPTVVVGVSDVVLVYLVAARIFTRERSAVFASALLMTTPAHFIHSRLAVDFLYPLAFVLAWLVCLLRFLETRRPPWLFAATTCLGIGFYSYIASVVLMPAFFVVTCLALATRRNALRPFLVAAAGFGWPLIAAVPWVLTHRDAVADTAQRYGLDASLGPRVLPHAPMLTVLGAITERVSLYWRYFDPAYLFIAGGGYTMNTTHRVGVFLAPIAVCLAIGLNEIVNRRRTLTNALLLAGLIAAPLPACLVGEPYAVQRELVVLPFVVLIAVYGAELLTSASRRRSGRIAGWILLALIPVQFCVFYADYFTTYRARSAFGFGGNVGEALEDIIDREQVGAPRPVYLSADFRFVDLYWRLHLITHGRQDLMARTAIFNPATVDVASVPQRSLLLARVGTLPTSAAASGELRSVRVIRSVDQTLCCEVLEK